MVPTSEQSILEPSQIEQLMSAPDVLSWVGTAKWSSLQMHSTSDCAPLLTVVDSAALQRMHAL